MFRRLQINTYVLSYVITEIVFYVSLKTEYLFLCNFKDL